MSDNINLGITSQFQGAGLTQAEVAVKQAAVSFDQLSADQQKAATATLSSAQNYARLAAAMGQPAEGAARLRAEFASVGAASEKQGIAIQSQIVRLDQASQSMSKGATYAQQFGQAMTQSLIGIVGPAAAA